MKNKLHWLAGLLDGEGHFGISVTNSTNRTYDFRPLIVIEMLKDCWLEEAISIYKHFNIKYQYTERYTVNNRLACKLIINESKGIKILCDLLNDKLILKQKHSCILKKFTYGRVIKTCNRYGLKWIDWELLNSKLNNLSSIRELNKTNNKYIHTKDSILEFYNSIKLSLPRGIKK